MLHEKGDAPRFVEEEPEVYEESDLKKFFAACDDEERLWFEFFLMTGEREQEVQHTYWRDIKFADSVLRVTHKPDIGWSPKAYKEREIPDTDEAATVAQETTSEVESMPLGISDFRMQAQARFSRLL